MDQVYNLKGQSGGQRTGTSDPPFMGGGRCADLPGGYQQRDAADKDWRANLARNARQDREQIGVPKKR